MFRISFVYVFVFATSVLARNSTDECVLNIQPSSSCGSANWDGFLGYGCCESTFEEYLSALAKHANQTGSIFLNSSQQQSCRSSLEVLVSMVARKITDGKWVRAVYQCLGQNQSVGLDQSQNVQDDHHAHKKKMSIGIWILIGGLVGMMIIIITTLWIFFRKSVTGKSPEYKDGVGVLDSPFPKELTIKLTVKDIYAATNDLKATNFIGEGNAGKVYKGVLANGRNVAIKHIVNDGEKETFVREITKFVDPKLKGDYSLKAFEFIINLAVSCIGVKQQRPSMEQVVVGLEKALDMSIRDRMCSEFHSQVY
ncbi:hypothetical protein L1987_11344 [Smallanthus sonchifolius]|uniref:Uncharacterized protein n=1 Tax=Smallanthus sonchifolius TaxID=185202 RepID=A0ACB9JBJ3_9ASTR|nr:hypothetical protein L1987_11344 [Smallanthus sonchifolius]